MATTARAGRDVALSFGPLKDAAGGFIDMSGAASASWWLAKGASSTAPADIFVKKSTAQAPGGISLVSTIVLGATQWTALVTIAPADTAAVAPTPVGQTYYHELQVKDASGKDYTFELDDGGNFVLLASLIPPL